MAERYAEVTLRIKVTDLPRSERRMAAKEADMLVSELPRLADVEAREIGSVVRSAVDSEDAQAEAFAGSEMWVRFAKVEVASSRWVDTPARAAQEGASNHG